jgi:plasmid stabilization system protein ParE
MRLTPGHRSARHVPIFECCGDAEIVILRILHDSMDPTLHVTGSDP